MTKLRNFYLGAFLTLLPGLALAAPATPASPLSAALNGITATFDVATVTASIGTIAAAMASVFVVVWGSKRVLGFFRG